MQISNEAGKAVAEVKHVVITGAGGGLGTQLTKLYCERGWFVYGYGRSENDATRAAEAAYAGLYAFSSLNVMDTDAVNAAAERLRAETEHIDVLINAAGILTKNGEKHLEDFDVDDSLRVFDINALGPLRMTKAFLPLLKKGETRVLVNISSEAASMQTNNNYIRRYDYCMSKAAVNMQSVILQRYLQPDGIKVLAVHPGWMQTEMGGKRAPIHPSVSAAGIMELVERYSHNLDSPIFMDYNGTPRPW